jgi:hypothetical protein
MVVFCIGSRQYRIKESDSGYATDYASLRYETQASGET